MDPMKTYLKWAIDSWHKDYSKCIEDKRITMEKV